MQQFADSVTAKLITHFNVVLCSKVLKMVSNLVKWNSLYYQFIKIPGLQRAIA
jgi:hypothetical protein